MKATKQQATGLVALIKDEHAALFFIVIFAIATWDVLFGDIDGRYVALIAVYASAATVIPSLSSRRERSRRKQRRALAAERAHLIKQADRIADSLERILELQTALYLPNSSREVGDKVTVRPCSDYPEADV